MYDAPGRVALRRRRVGRVIGRTAVAQQHLGATQVVDELFELAVVGLEREHPIGHAAQQPSGGRHRRERLDTERPLRRIAVASAVGLTDETLSRMRRTVHRRRRGRPWPTPCAACASTMRISVGSS